MTPSSNFLSRFECYWSRSLRPGVVPRIYAQVRLQRRYAALEQKAAAGLRTEDVRIYSLHHVPYSQGRNDDQGKLFCIISFSITGSSPLFDGQLNARATSVGEGGKTKISTAKPYDNCATQYHFFNRTIIQNVNKHVILNREYKHKRS